MVGMPGKAMSELALTAITLLVAGCGASTSTPAAPAATGNSAAPQSSAGSVSAGPKVSDADAAKAVCALFTRDQAQPVVGDVYQLAAAPGPDFGTNGVLGLGPTCMYVTAPQRGASLPALLVAVDDQTLAVARERPADHPPADRVKINLFSGPGIEAVSGLGDEAIFAPSQVGGGSLFVRKGPKYLVIIPQTLTDVPADEKQRETDLARVILTKI